MGDLARRVAPSTNVLFDLRPALRIGGTMQVGGASVTSYIEAGALFRLNEGSIDVSLPNGPNPSASVPLALEQDEIMGILALGTAIAWGGYEARLVYEGALGSETSSQAGSLKFAIKF